MRRARPFFNIPGAKAHTNVLKGTFSTGCESDGIRIGTCSDGIRNGGGLIINVNRTVRFFFPLSLPSNCSKHPGNILETSAPAHLLVGVRIEVKQEAVLRRAFIQARLGASRTLAHVALGVRQHHVGRAEAESACASARSRKRGAGGRGGGDEHPFEKQ